MKSPKPRASKAAKKKTAMRKAARPFVAATFAMTVDGKITTRTFSPVDFTSREDKLHLLRMRSLGDAVLIGRSTLSHDNVRLGLPDPKMRAEREARGQAPYPLRVIVSNEGRIDPELKIFQTDISRIVIFSTTRMPRKYQVALREKATLRLSEARSGRSAPDVAGPAERLRRAASRLRGRGGVIPRSARITVGGSTQPHDRALHLRRERRAHPYRARHGLPPGGRPLFSG